MNQIDLNAEVETLITLLVTKMQNGNREGRHELFHEYLRQRAKWRAMDNNIDSRIKDAFANAGWRNGEHLDMADFTFVPLVRMHQHPVGHGGFHSGALGNGEARIRWVYDCGSWRSTGRRALTREINNYASFGDGSNKSKIQTFPKKRNVDLFFISHFDCDHVSGISELLDAVSVDTVVIPYLDSIDCAAILATSATREGVSEQMGTFMSDVARWFLDRGARRVIQVEQGGADTSPGMIRLEPPAAGDSPGERLNGLIFVSESGEEKVLRDTGVVDIAAGAGWIVKLLTGCATDWALLPFVSKASDASRHRLENELASLVGLSPKAKGFSVTFLDRLTKGSFRRKLKAAYKRFGLGDANTVSMSLYAGPYRDCVLTSRRLISSDDARERRPAGWLLTGDSELGNAIRRRDWLNFFQPFNNRIGRLMLPHHGAARNFNSEILSVANNPRLFACANANDPVRPHENVLDAIDRTRFRVVETSTRTGIDEASGPSALEGRSYLDLDYLR